MSLVPFEDLPWHARIAGATALLALAASSFLDGRRLAAINPTPLGRLEFDLALLGFVALAWFVVAFAWIGGTALLRSWFVGDETPRDPGEILGALATRLRGTVEGATCEARLRGRRATVEVVREGFFGARYEIRLETPLGAPRAGRIESLEQLHELAWTQDVPLFPFAQTLLENQNEWHGLFRIYHVHSIEFGEGFVRASASWGGGVLAPSDEAGRLVRLLEKLAVVSDALVSPVDVKGRASADERCPYCHDALATDAEVRACPACGTRHHAECLGELGRCAIFGCASRAGAIVVHVF